MWQVLPSIISAGANLLGGIFGQKTQQENQAANLAWQREQFQQQQANWNKQFEYQMSRDNVADTWSREQVARNEALQREFAQSGIQWRVEDAKKAGIHPLAAIGGGGAAYGSPSISLGGGRGPSGSVGGFSGTGSASSPLPASMAAMGQDLTRAMMASANAETRDTAFQETVREMQLQNMAMRNDLLASQIQRLKNGGTGPAIPTPPAGTATEAPLDTKIEKRNRLIMGN